MKGTINIGCPKFRFGESGLCMYCGSEISIEIEHVIPITFFVTERKHTHTVNGFTTYACQLCNGALGDKVFWQFHDRYDFAVSKIQQQGRKYYKRSEWSEKELQELDYSLRSHIEHEQAKAKHYISRIEWEGSREMLKLKQKVREQVEALENDFVKEFMSYWIHR